MAVPRVERRIPPEAGVRAGRAAPVEPVVVTLEVVSPHAADARTGCRPASVRAGSPALAGTVVVAAGWDVPERFGLAVRSAFRSGTRRWVLWVRRVRIAIGPPSFQLRHRSLAECHVRSSVADAVAVLGGCPPMERLELLGPPEAIGADPSEGVRAPGRLRIRWSWPAVPVWVSIRPWSSGRAVVGIAIRGGRRPRYPRRYFAVCHRALHDLRSLVQDGVRRVGEP